jgi:hypothetical protein
MKLSIVACILLMSPHGMDVLDKTFINIRSIYGMSVWVAETMASYTPSTDKDVLHQCPCTDIQLLVSEKDIAHMRVYTNLQCRLFKMASNKFEE